MAKVAPVFEKRGEYFHVIMMGRVPGLNLATYELLNFAVWLLLSNHGWWVVHVLIQWLRFDLGRICCLPLPHWTMHIVPGKGKRIESPTALCFGRDRAAWPFRL